MLSPRIRIGDRVYDYSGPEPSELTYGMCLFEIWREIAWCLEHWTQVSLDERRRNQAAGLIFNPVTHPMWTNIGKGYGAGVTKTVLRTLEASKRLLKKAEKSTDEDQLQSFRRSALTPLNDLPSPLCFLFQSAMRAGDDEIMRTLNRDSHQAFSRQDRDGDTVRHGSFGRVREVLAARAGGGEELESTLAESVRRDKIAQNDFNLSVERYAC